MCERAAARRVASGRCDRTLLPHRASAKGGHAAPINEREFVVLHIAMGIGLLAGLLFGILAAATGSPVLLAIAEGVRPLGTAFVNAIQMVVIPLVMATVFVGVARLGDIRKVGRLGAYSIGFFWATTIPAILIGMGFMTVALRFSPEVTVPGVEAVARQDLPGLVDFLLRLIPRNPFEAATQGALLPLIVFTVLFAAAASTLEAGMRERLVDFADAVSAALIKLVYWVLWTGPIGVFGLAAPVTAQTGWAMLQSLAAFVVAVILGLFVFIGLVYMPLVKFVGGMSPVRFLRGSVGTATVGFTTTSSVATLPVMLTESQENLTCLHQWQTSRSRWGRRSTAREVRSFRVRPWSS